MLRQHNYGQWSADYQTVPENTPSNPFPLALCITGQWRKEVALKFSFSAFSRYWKHHGICNSIIQKIILFKDIHFDILKICAAFCLCEQFHQQEHKHI